MELALLVLHLFTFYNFLSKASSAKLKKKKGGGRGFFPEENV
jgi:hypothetical protein